MSNIENILEALLFANGDALSVNKMANILEVSVDEVINSILVLKEKYKDSGIELIEINKSYQFATNKNYYDYVKKLFNYSPEKKLSKTVLEVLAIIAYKQPITKFEIDNIRGVNSDNQIYQLLNRELIEVKKKLNTIGNPNLYGTTAMFLKSFGLKNIKELPKLEDISSYSFDTNETKGKK